LGGGGMSAQQALYFDESMNSFYTTASSQIPNKQGDFARWCYGSMPSAKEGDKKALMAQSPPNWIDG